MKQNVYYDSHLSVHILAMFVCMLLLYTYHHITQKKSLGLNNHHGFRSLSVFQLSCALARAQTRKLSHRHENIDLILIDNAYMKFSNLITLSRLFGPVSTTSSLMDSSFMMWSRLQSWGVAEVVEARYVCARRSPHLDLLFASHSQADSNDNMVTHLIKPFGSPLHTGRDTKIRVLCCW